MNLILVALGTIFCENGAIRYYPQMIVSLRFIIVIKKFSKLEKEYRDCIKRKWRQDWDMNQTL